jgi:hypothetical protein
LATCALCAVPITAAGPAEAVLQSPNALIARTVDAALRRAIPASNSDVQQLQTKLEVKAGINQADRLTMSSHLSNGRHTRAMPVFFPVLLMVLMRTPARL